MLQDLRMLGMALAIALITPWATTPAEASCQLIKATHSAASRLKLPRCPVPLRCKAPPI